MAFTEDNKQRIIAAISAKAPQFSACSICHSANWALQDGLVILTIQASTKGMVLGGPALPCIAIVCSNCGNTHLLNVIMLGLRDILDK